LWDSTLVELIAYVTNGRRNFIVEGIDECLQADPVAAASCSLIKQIADCVYSETMHKGGVFCSEVTEVAEVCVDTEGHL
jgi:hypothetical protein